MKKYGLGEVKLWVQTLGVSISPTFIQVLKSNYNVPHLNYDKIFFYILDNKNQKYPVYTFINNSSKSFKLIRIDQSFKLSKNLYLIDIEFDKKIDIYDDEIEKTKLNKIACIEANNHLAVTLSHFCIHFFDKEECKFCSINNWSDNNQTSIRQKIIAIKKYIESNNVKHLSITTGTINRTDKGVKSIIKFCSELRDRGVLLPIAVEFEPINNTDYFNDLQKLGITTVSINIEFLQPNIRKLLMPGKGKIDIELYKKNW